MTAQKPYVFGAFPVEYHGMESSHAQQLERLAPLLARNVAAEQRAGAGARLIALAELILKKNETMNLTADDTPELLWQRHIEDGLQAAAALDGSMPSPAPGGWLADGAAVLDVGAGGGLPGLIWGALWPGLSIALLEPRQRRADWLREACAALGMERLSVYAQRAETFGREAAHREQYALVTARALARLPVLAELTLPFARVGGFVAAIKSADCLAELNEAAYALGELGSAPEAVKMLPYTRGDGKACAVVLIPKLRPTPPMYPRHDGVPAKHPLY